LGSWLHRVYIFGCLFHTFSALRAPLAATAVEGRQSRLWSAGHGKKETLLAQTERKLSSDLQTTAAGKEVMREAPYIFHTTQKEKRKRTEN